MSSKAKSSASGDNGRNLNGISSLKKMIHNDNERKRKKRMIELVDQILDSLPMKCTGKTSRISRLEQLKCYITELRNKNDALMFANPCSVHVQEINQLKKYIEHLERLNHNYRKLLKIAGISAATAVEMGDREWEKPLKYSNKVFLDENKKGKSLKELIGRRGKKKGSSDDDEEEESDESDSDIEEITPGKAPQTNNTNGVIQVINPGLQPTPPVQYVLLSTGLNTPAQLVPIAAPTILSNVTTNSLTSTPTIILSNNISTPASTSTQLTKVQQNSSKADKPVKKSKRAKAKEKIVNENESEVNPEPDNSDLTTTIEKCKENVDSSKKDQREPAKSVADESIERPNKRRLSAPGENIVLESSSKKVKPNEKDHQQQSLQSNIGYTEKPPAQVQRTSSTNVSPEKNSNEPTPTNQRSSISAKSPIVYQVSDSAENRLTEPKTSSANSTSSRCNYSTESLLQQQPSTGETQVDQSNEGSETTLNQQQSSNSIEPQTPTYQQQQQQQQSVPPSFTVKDSLISNSSTTPLNSQNDKHSFDLIPSIASATSKRNLTLEMDSLVLPPSGSVISSTNLFDPNMLSITSSDSQQQQFITALTSWSSEPNQAGSGSVNQSNCPAAITQTYSNTNPSSVFFSNQPFSSLLSTTPTPFDPSAVPNVGVFSSPHKPTGPMANSSSSSFNNFMPDFNTGSYSLTSADDQQLESSIVESFPRSSRCVSSSVTSNTTTTSKSQNTRNSANVTSTASSSTSYGKSKASASKANSTAATTTTTSSSRAKTNASNSKKCKAAASSSSEPAKQSTSSTTSTSNVFSRHHHHHSHPTHTPHHRPPLLNDNYLHHIIPDMISPSAAFVSVTSVAGHSSSVMSSSTASSGSTTFHHPHSHPHHPSHQFPHPSYSNFLSSSQTDPSSYDSRSYDSSSVVNPSDSSNNELTDHSQFSSSYPIFRPQSQTHSFPVTTSSSYQSGSSTSSSAHHRNFVNPPPPPVYPHHHSASASSSNHVTNFNIGNILPDFTLNSPGSSGYGTSEFLTSGSKTQSSRSSSSSSSTATSTTTSSANTFLPNLPKFTQLAKTLPSISSTNTDPLSFSASSSSYQTPGSATSHHSHQYHHPPSHPFYPPPPPPPPSQTSVTYSTSHPLNSHFPSSSSSSQSRNSTRANTGFISTTDELDGSGSSVNNARSSSLSSHHYYPIAPHNATATACAPPPPDMSMFNTNQSSHHHHQSASHHLTQHHHHFSNTPSNAHAFNQTSSAPTSVSNFASIQSTISSANSGSTSGFGSTTAASSASSSSTTTPRLQFPFFNLN